MFNVEDIVFFGGKKMKLQEFYEAYDLIEETEEARELIVEKLIKKDKLKFLDNTDKNSPFLLVGKELELERKIQEIEEESDRIEDYRAMKKKEGKLVYEEIEIDFPAFSSAQELVEYCAQKLRLNSTIREEDGLFIVTIFDVSESDMSAIKRLDIINRSAEGLAIGVKRLSDNIIRNTKTVTDKVAVPIAKAGLNAGLSIGKQALKTGIQLGSNIISNTTANARQMKYELSRDGEVLKAKKVLIDAKDAVKRLLKISSPSDRIRVK